MARSQRDRSPALGLTRKEVRLALGAPELVPALVWLVSMCKRSESPSFNPQPPLEELSAVVARIGAEAQAMLATTARGRRLTRRLRFISYRGLLDVRAKAASRLGLDTRTWVEPE